MSFIVSLLFLLSCTSSVLSNQDDDKALLKIKQQLGERFYTGSSSTGRINRLGIYHIANATTLPNAICKLTELEFLEIYDSPGLYGRIPSCIANLSKLHDLSIVQTSLSGRLPYFQNHQNIASIYLPYNKFTGSIPASLATCPKLTYLDLSSNNLTGKLPPALGAISTLILFDNNLTGKIPSSCGSIDFATFSVGKNHLTGDASFLLGRKKMTETIYLSNNNFTFDLTYVEFSSNLITLGLSHNNIYGKIPRSLGALMSLDVSYNKLCGEIPQGGFPMMYQTQFFSNNLCLCGYPLQPCPGSGPALAPAVPPVPPF